MYITNLESPGDGALDGPVLIGHTRSGGLAPDSETAAIIH